MKPLLLKESTASTGYLILCVVVTGLFALAYNDPMFIIFTIFLLLVFIIGASLDAGKPEQDLELVGWSGNNMNLVVPYGIAGGVISFLIGAIITRNIEPSSIYTSPLQVFVPDLSTNGMAFAAITSASVIPAFFASTANIISQWFIVAPGEEALSKIALPYAFKSIFKNVVLAYILGTLFWVGEHIPKFVAQGVDGRMYIVLLVVAGIGLAVMIITRNVLAAVISHATFNTNVEIFPGVNQTAFYTILIIVSVLIYIWFKSKAQSKTARRA